MYHARIPLWQDNHPQEPELVQESSELAAGAYGTQIWDRIALNGQPDAERD